MTVKLSKAKQLCTKTEYELVHQSSHKQVQELTPARLKQKIDRARKLRDKYRKLAQSQRRESRGKQKPRRTRAAEGSENTEIKAQVFAETLERFEKVLKRAEGTTAKKTEKKSTKKTTTKKATSKKKTTTRKKQSSAKAKDAGKRKGKVKRETKASSDSQAKSAPKTKPSILARKPPTITAEPTVGSPFGMRGTGATAALESRATRRKKSSKHARPGTLDSQFARTSKEKIQGHVSAQTKRRQAKRDS